MTCQKNKEDKGRASNGWGCDQTAHEKIIQQAVCPLSYEHETMSQEEVNSEIFFLIIVINNQFVMKYYDFQSHSQQFF